MLKSRAWIEIDRNALIHNICEISNSLQADTKIMAVVNARAYGHNDIELSKILKEAKVEAFAVATLEEGITLRKNGIEGLILILGHTCVQDISLIKKYNLTQTIIDFNHAKSLSTSDVEIDVHLKIDTGMHRLGIDSENIDEIIKIMEFENLNVKGIFTHLSSADSLDKKDVEFTNLQIEKFNNLLEELSQKNIKFETVHVQSSYGLINHPTLEYSYVRMGIALYGVLSNYNEHILLSLNLKPVLSLKSRVVLIREVKKGEGVGYSRAFVPERNTKIAIISIGYADGLPRNLSNESGFVYINNVRCPIVGKVCMDHTIVDVTGVDVNYMDEVEVIGDKPCIRANEVAYFSQTITNELLSRLGTRLEVVVK